MGDWKNYQSLLIDGESIDLVDRNKTKKSSADDGELGGRGARAKNTTHREINPILPCFSLTCDELFS